jgi:hypothetical protein
VKLSLEPEVTADHLDFDVVGLVVIIPA